MTDKQKEDFRDWLTNNMQFTSVSRVQHVIDHVEHYFCPIPSPGDNQSLEEAAKKILDKHFPHSYYYANGKNSERHKLHEDKCFRCDNEDELIEAMIEFAASRPSIDIVDELREACPIGRGMAWKDGYVTHWNECCDKLLELLNGKK